MSGEEEATLKSVKNINLHQMRVQTLLATSEPTGLRAKEFGDLYKSYFPRANVRGGFNGR